MNPREAITKQVHAMLEREPRINLHRFPIDISNRDGVVTLQGDVADVDAKKLALELAGSAKGVSGVIDRLLVLPGEPRGDGAIRDSLAAFLLAEQELRNCSITSRGSEEIRVLRRVEQNSAGEIEISVSDGIITLEGHVISQSHRRFAGVLGWWTPGRRDVVNALAIEPHYEDRDDEVAESLRIVLEADPLLDADQIAGSCTNRVLTLDGTVRSPQQSRRAELDAWALFGVERVVNRLTVSD